MSPKITEAKRQARRVADRRRAVAAVEALMSSPEGWRPDPELLVVGPLARGDLEWAVFPLAVVARSEGWEVVVEPNSSEIGAIRFPDRRILSINTSPRLSANRRTLAVVRELSHMLIDGYRDAVREGRSSDEHGELDLGSTEQRLVAESIAIMVCGSLGVDTSYESIPLMASWIVRVPLETIERCASLIDRVAKRLEDAVASSEGETKS